MAALFAVGSVVATVAVGLVVDLADVLVRWLDN